MYAYKKVMLLNYIYMLAFNLKLTSHNYFKTFPFVTHVPDSVRSKIHIVLNNLTLTQKIY